MQKENDKKKDKDTTNQETANQETANQETTSKESASQESASQELGKQETGIMESENKVTKTKENEVDEIKRKEIDNKEAVVILNNVKKSYKIGEKNFLVLAGVNLQIVKGEFLAIVGKSGSGKSTLLNLMGGIDFPTEGKVVVNGKELNGLREKQLSRFRGENIGFVFQSYQLMPTLTVIENVIMPMDFSKRIPASQRRERAMTLLEKVGMATHADKFPSALSGGEQQRVAIARALANNPDIIFADEPTGNLDSNTSEEIFHLLKDFSDGGKSIIMVTHNNELAERCQRVIKISDGQIIEDILKQ
jgi:putative ABC transport system ATP-binding protein